VNVPAATVCAIVTVVFASDNEVRLSQVAASLAPADALIKMAPMTNDFMLFSSAMHGISRRGRS
jgi:hypothetical protein